VNATLSEGLVSLGAQSARLRLGSAPATNLDVAAQREGLSLARGEVELWVAPSPQNAPTDLREWLTSSEQQHAACLQPSERSSYTVVHALLRQVLGAYARGSVEIARGGHGSPRVRAPRFLRDVRVSLTHTSGLAAIALARGVRVGIDAEPVDERRSAAKALMALYPQQPHASDPLFVWTATEAALKATGHGLGCTRSVVARMGARDVEVAIGGRRRGDVIRFEVWVAPWPGFQVTAAIQSGPLRIAVLG
jgi:4'-phosphopantetheinyl transferase